MYPSGINQDVSQQKGTFVEVKGYGEQMEGRSRPAFFRGVATVVTKLFNIVQVRSLSPKAIPSQIR
jgi:pantoate--beta-alanine ligase